MDVSVVKIGNSKGIRLSKTILKKYDIKESVEMILEDGFIVIKPKAEPRKGWDKAFRRMHDNRDDKPLMSDIFEEESFEEWS